MSNKLIGKCTGPRLSHVEYKRPKSFEMNLISEIKKKPQLQTIARFKGQNNRREVIEAWGEISRTLGVPAHVCRNRWNKLLVAFDNQRAMRESKDGYKIRPLNWPYYDHMTFLLKRKHLFRSQKTDDTLEVSVEDSKFETKTELVESPKVPNLPDGDERVESVEDPNIFQEVAVQPLPARNHAITLETTRKEEQPLLRIARVCSMQAGTITTEPFTITDNYPSPAQFVRSFTVDNHDEGTSHTYDGGSHLSCRAVDSNEQFLMSCYTTMERLSRRRNALVRLKIQQLMYDAEFADDFETRHFANNR
uniref:MADF domain-containing protein n=1 Tax=Anopheles funestus TaxID=62324 RepID=A0A182S4F7_ANOFN